MAPASRPAASRAFAPVRVPRAGAARPASSAMTLITTSSSMRVNPRAVRVRATPLLVVHDVGVLAVATGLPVGAVALHVERVRVRLAGVQVDVLLAPGIVELPVLVV